MADFIVQWQKRDLRFEDQLFFGRKTAIGVSGVGFPNTASVSFLGRKVPPALILARLQKLL